MTIKSILRISGVALLCPVLCMALLLTATPAQADWIPGDGHKMHYPQLPDEQGWDVNATFPANLADDWRCSETGPVLDFHFWGSWRDFDGDTKGDVGQIQFFTLRIWSDVPAVPPNVPYSHPGELLWEQDIDAWSEVPIDPPTFEHWFDPFTPEVVNNDHGEYFQYNIDLTTVAGVTPFAQVQDTIYWLSITAHIVDDGTQKQWGWKSTVNHFNDDATFALEGDWGKWTEMYEPPRYNEFAVALDPNGTFVAGGGTNFFTDGTDENGWYSYPQFDWWNIWFYDNPFRSDHYKEANIQLIVEALDETAPSKVNIAVNFSTDAWSNLGLDRPPLPSDPNETQNIGRTIIWSWDPTQGLIPPAGIQVDEFWTLTDYNPEWISIDVQGYNFKIRGNMVHECVKTSLDLAFVVTGGDPTGACCYPDGTCQGALSAADCAAQGGTYLGVGSVCLGDGNNDGIDDACGGATVLGACCLQDGTCMTTVAANCALAGGTYLGDNTVCLGDADNNGVDDACETPAKKGACCWPDGTCSVVTAAKCVKNGGTYLGDNSACLGDGDLNGVDDACEKPDPDFKWEQLPDLDPTGMDVNASYRGDPPLPNYILADDFECTVTGPITRIHVYGSWVVDILPPGGPTDVRFVLSIHDDIPAVAGDPDSFSRPGELLCLLTDLPFEVRPYATDLQEGFLWPPNVLWPNGDRVCWEYIFYLPPDICIQQGTAANPVIYWLDVQAYPTQHSGAGLQPRFGWKSSLQHWNDDATWAFGQDDFGVVLDWQEMIYPTVHPMAGQSVDLAFKIIGTQGTPTPTGACCWPDGTCSIETKTDCESTAAGGGGTYQGDGTPCLGDANNNGIDDACETTNPTGACCYDVGGSAQCTNTTHSNCVLNLGGTWYPGQDCNDANFVCPTLSIQGACCWEDAAGNMSCTNTTQDECHAAYGGTWYLGQDCNNPNFVCQTPQPLGACCYGDPASPSCVNTTEDLCKTHYNGTWYPGQDCSSFDCPTVIQTGACCYQDAAGGLNCLSTTQADCLQLYGGTWYPGQACADIDCDNNQPTKGACCYVDPQGNMNCLETTHSDCLSIYGGTWYLGQTCADVDCPTPPDLGACCYGDPANPACIDGITQLVCEAQFGGNWYAGQTCATIDCPTPDPLGACCFDLAVGGSGCVTTTHADCLQTYGGTWYGGQDCSMINCDSTQPPKGACCYADSTGGMNCINTTHSDCLANYGGTWYLGQDCINVDCPIPPDVGACCYGDPANPACIDGLTQLQCEAHFGGSWYAGQTCATIDCPTAVPVGACCYEIPGATPGCVTTTHSDCLQTYGGTWYPGQDCSTVDCGHVPSKGACCYEDAAGLMDCINTTHSDCIANYGGTWYLGQDCANFDCPQVHKEGACCYEETGLCLDGTWQFACEAHGGTWYAGLTCTDIPCPSEEPKGACCYDNPGAAPGCVNTTKADCYENYGGTWYAGQDCATFDCPTQPPLGVCCYGDPDSPSCANTTHADCIAAYGGNWYAGQDCATFTCPLPSETGACCIVGASGPFCIQGIAQTPCEGYYGGIWHGGLSCFDVSCSTTELPGACCYTDAAGNEACANVTEHDCEVAYGGTWYAGQNCATFTCPQGDLTGACCWPDGSCTIETEPDCIAAGGTYANDGTVCYGDGNGDGIDDACGGIIIQGACCLPSGACVSTHDEWCTLLGGTFHGYNSLCIGDLDGNGVDDACEDPEPIWKWLQPPNLEPTGMDVRMTDPVILADDFLCTSPGDITEISIWASWWHDEFPNGGSPADVSFVLSMHTDVPALHEAVPVPKCPSTGDGWDIIDGLPAGTVIRGAGRLDNFSAVAVQDGGGLGGKKTTFTADLQINMSGAGDPVNGFARTLIVPVSVEIHTGPPSPGDDVQSYPTEMFQLQGELFGDPDFCVFRVRAGSGFGLPSPGHTTLTRTDGYFDVDSFFDVFFEIDFEGCADSPLGGMTGTTQGTVRMVTPEPDGPDCTTPNIGKHSYPGELLCLKTIERGDFTWEEVPVTEEDWYDPLEDIYESPGDHNCIKYTFKLNPGECVQEGTLTDPIVYWLDVQAFVPDANAFIGWKTSKVHWNDDATWNFGNDPVTMPWTELRYPPEHPFSPQLLDFAFEVSSGCCIGATGNVDGSVDGVVDIGDLTALIGYLFIPPFPVPDCYGEGNVDGSQDGVVDIGDLTQLIGYLFIPPFQPPEPCR